MASTEFVPAEFVVPAEATFGDLHLVPLGPQHNDADHAAWTSSIDHIRSTPGFPHGSWPEPMTSVENLRDLEGHADDFRLRRGFTYAVLDPNEAVVGCVYIYPSDDQAHDAEIRSWVTADRSNDDRVLHEAVSGWLREAWPFGAVRYAAR